MGPRARLGRARARPKGRAENGPGGQTDKGWEGRARGPAGRSGTLVVTLRTRIRLRTELGAACTEASALVGLAL